MNEGHFHVRVDVFDAYARFVTSAACAIRVRPGTAAWDGVLTDIEPYAHLGSGRHHIRLRDGAQAVIIIQARQRLGRDERYPFVGEGPPPALDRL